MFGKSEEKEAYKLPPCNKGKPGGVIKDSWLDDYLLPGFAEFLGSALIVSIGILASSYRGLSMAESMCSGLLAVALGNAFGCISGALFNPAVSVATCITGAMDVQYLALYVISQILGGIVGAMSAHYISGNKFHGVPAPPLTSYSGSRAVFAEITFAFFLTITTLLTNDPRNNTADVPMSVACAATAGGVVCAPFSGGVLNPIRALGSAISARIMIPRCSVNVWSSQPLYWVGSVVGASLAAVIYKFIFAHKDDRWSAPNAPSMGGMKTRAQQGYDNTFGNNGPTMGNNRY